MMKLFTFLFSSLFLLLSANAPAEETKPQIICFGDSITKRGYHEELGTLLEIETSHAGVAGHNTKQGLRRMEKDVIEKKPALVVILFGTNDLRADSERAHVPLKDYRKNLQEMVKRCEDAGSKVIICTLPPITEAVYFTRHEPKEYDAKGGLTKMIQEYRKTATEVAQKNKLPLVDLNKLLSAHPEWVSKDGVHPSPAGVSLIAKYVAEAARPLLVEEKAK
ncbi:GDSL-type esterase/lipase family protein [Akkermansiaceae bacterium]|nr:GDSL-type esterase/lipase family protein [Akkermansiaceae bacterium]MDB4271119.1 GDSL-type esterase/lipase family protein [bacterium]MDA7877502.1 GDSL-type esterase/lipase family protein [Akkermansiaceae bacterium]MDB0067917.1 GDSL-type esterase/lipase family protein [Akkermansiaceae bacterium]MDB4302595.1 GDSL-type esterase/lipase family protein [bacterium]